MSWLHDLVIAMAPLPFWGMAALVALALAACLAYCFRRLRVLRLIEDLPTARVRSAAQGYVELEGKVEFPGAAPLTSPLRGIACVWWAYRIEELDPQHQAEPAPWDAVTALWDAVLGLFGARGAGRLVEAGRSHDCFLLRDDTGACVIDPDQARITGADTRVWTRGSRRFEESVIRAGQALYAVGLFRTPHDVADAAERREAGALVSAWQLDRLALARRFDANRDGQLDAAEWQAAWQAATDAVRKRRAGQAPAPELHVLCDPGDGRPYLLSALGQRRLANRLWFETVTSLLAAMLAATLLAGSLVARGLG